MDQSGLFYKEDHDTGEKYLYRLTPNPSGLSSAAPVETVVLQLTDQDVFDLKAAFASPDSTAKVTRMQPKQASPLSPLLGGTSADQPTGGEGQNGTTQTQGEPGQ